jgi:hypothetical protein
MVTFDRELPLLALPEGFLEGILRRFIIPQSGGVFAAPWRVGYCTGGVGLGDGWGVPRGHG